MAMFEIIDKEENASDTETIIKVVGVGGAGGNAVDHMIREGVMGVDFVAANTDAQALKRSVAHRKIRLGKSGLGAGAKPEVGRRWRNASRLPRRCEAPIWFSLPLAWAAAPARAPRRSSPRSRVKWGF